MIRNIIKVVLGGIILILIINIFSKQIILKKRVEDLDRIYNEVTEIYNTVFTADTAVTKIDQHYKERLRRSNQNNKRVIGYLEITSFKLRRDIFLLFGTLLTFYILLFIRLKKP